MWCIHGNLFLYCLSVHATISTTYFNILITRIHLIENNIDRIETEKFPSQSYLSIFWNRCNCNLVCGWNMRGEVNPIISTSSFPFILLANFQLRNVDSH